MSDAVLVSAPTEEDAGASATLFVTEGATFNEIRADNRNFEYYERQFQEVLMNLENDDILDAFRAEYAALHHSFLKSHDGEARLLKKCVELQSDIESCTAKLLAAEDLSRGDKATIEALRIEIDSTQRKARATREREAILKDKVAGLKQTLRDLEERASRPVEATAQEAALQTLLRTHEFVLKEKETLEYQLVSARQDDAGAARRLERLLENKRERDAELQVLRDAALGKQREADAHRATRMRKEEALRLAREVLAQHAAHAQAQQATMERLAKDGESHSEELRRVVAETEQLAETYQQLSRKLQQVNRTTQACNEENDALQKRTCELADELRLREVQVDAAGKAHKREMRLLEAVRRRAAISIAAQNNETQKRDALNEELAAREAERSQLSQAVEADERDLKSLTRSRDLLHGNCIGAVAQTARANAWLAERKNELQHLGHELRNCESYGQVQNDEMYAVARECAIHEAQLLTNATLAARLVAEVQAREKEIAEYIREAHDVEVRLAQQQTLLDAMIVERNAYTKHYAQLRLDVGDTARRFRLILAQIRQMQEEVVRLERFLHAEDESLNSLHQLRRVLDTHIRSIHLSVEKRTRGVSQLEVEIRHLDDVLVENEEEMHRQRRRVRDVVKERDLLGNQVVARGEELQRLYESVRVNAALLGRGSALYEERLKHIAQLQHHIQRISHDVRKLRQFTEKLPDLKRMLRTVTRDLGRERTRVRALLTECERPMNLHPNHMLAWSEPDAFALAKRIGELQRELVVRHAELDEKEKRIAECEKAYLQSKAAVARQPGPEMAEQITLYKGNLAKKAGQMRSMAASLKYFREQTEIYQEKYDALRESLNEMANTYIEERRRQCHAVAEKEKGRIEGFTATQGTEEDKAEDDTTYVGYVAPPRIVEEVIDEESGKKKEEQQQEEQQEEQEEQEEEEQKEQKEEVTPPPPPPTPPPTPPTVEAVNLQDSN